MGNAIFKHDATKRITWPDGRKVLRECRAYRAFFGDDCSWCQSPLHGITHVDHDHSCCDRQDGKCCAGCVRGVVHLRCNQEIARVDKLRAAGFTVTCPALRQEQYFSRRPVADLFNQIEPPEKPVRNPYTCLRCSGPMTAQSRFMICSRNPQCKREADRLAQRRSRGRA